MPPPRCAWLTAASARTTVVAMTMDAFRTLLLLQISARFALDGAKSTPESGVSKTVDALCLAQAAAHRRSDERRAALLFQHPGTHLPWRLVAHVLLVSA